MKTAIVALTVAIVGLAAGMYAQQAGFKRTVLQQADISTPGHEVITAVGEFQPGASPGRHTHPGEEVGYVWRDRLSSSRGETEQDGPSGRSFHHSGRRRAQRDEHRHRVAKIVATYIVEKGKPLATPASA